MITELEHKYFKTGSELNTWLSTEHKKSPGIWMVFYKKHTKIECIDYQDALDEALCFGWIDSLVKRLDDKQYIRKFTPRKNFRSWSNLNKLHLKRLIAQNRVTKAGFSAIHPSLLQELESMDHE